MQRLPLNGFFRPYLALKSRALLTHLAKIVEDIDRISAQYANQTTAQLSERVLDVRRILANGAAAADVEVPLFAIVRELARRELGMFPYRGQLLAALALNRRKVIQMDTGEGKTLVCPFTAILDVLCHRRVLVITANDYLSQRDANWMAPLYKAAGVKVGMILDYDNPRAKYAAYQMPIVYVDSSQLVFDYLKREKSLTPSGFFPIPFESAIIDEIDNVLIDHGTMPHVLAQPVEMNLDLFPLLSGQAQTLLHTVHIVTHRKEKTIDFTPLGQDAIERIAHGLGMSFPDGYFYIKSIVAANELYERDTDYLVENGKIVPIQEFSGRPMHGSSFQVGIHQAIELKERVPITHPVAAINRITLQSFYTRFLYLGGLSGSAMNNAIEFKMAYGLDVVPIPSRIPSRRVDAIDVVFRTRKEQQSAVQEEIKQKVEQGRPVLVGALSVDEAEAIATAVQASGVETRLLTARNHFEEAEVIEQAGVARRATIAARLAGRGVDIRLTEEARAAGGLHVIGVGRASDRRWDEQLLGRCARQGDPGSSVFILSLQDDLLQIFGSVRMQSLMRNLGMTEGVPIDSPLIMRRLRAAQRQLTLNNFLARQTWYLSERFLDSSRAAIFRRRDEIVMAASTRAFAAKAVEAATSYLVGLEGEQLRKALLAQSDTCDVPVPEELWPILQRNDPRLLVSEWKRAVLRAYYRRRVHAGLYANARERLILLRSVDYCWSRFLDESQRDVEALFATTFGRGHAQLVRDLQRIFIGTVEKLELEIAKTTQAYLMQIHSPSALKAIKYWRGLGISYGPGAEDEGADDGIDVPAEMLAVRSSTAEHRHQHWLLPEEPRPGDSGQLSLRVLAERFLRDQTEKRSASGDQWRAFLDNFLDFIKADKIPPARALKLIAPYMEHLAAQGLGRVGRSRQHKCLIAYFRYLQENGYIDKSERLTIGDSARRRVKAVLNKVRDPIFALRTSGVIASVLAYLALRYLKLVWVIPLSSVSKGGVLGLREPSLNLLDGLVSGGNFLHATIGAAGLLPVIAMRASFRLFGRENIGSPIACVPFSACISAAFALFYAAASGRHLSMFQVATVAVFIFVGAQIVATAVWFIDMLDVIPGVALVLWINCILLTSHWLGTGRIEAAVSPWAGPVFFGAALVLHYFYSRYSVVQLKAIHTGKFDFERGQVSAKPVLIRLRTVFDYQSYIYSIFLISLATSWLTWHHSNPPENLRNGMLMLACYIALVLVLQYQTLRYRLSLERVTGFLASRGMLLESLQEPSLKLRHRLWLLRNAGFELSIAGGLWFAFWTPASGLDGILTRISFVASFSLLAYLTVELIGDFRFQVTPVAAGVDINIPEENVREGSWLGRNFTRLKEQRGWIAVIAVLAGAIQFVEYLCRLAIWLAHRIR